MGDLSEVAWKQRFISTLCKRLIDGGLGMYDALEDAGAHADRLYPKSAGLVPETEAELVFMSLLMK